MKNLFLLFNHRLTDEQRAAAKKKLGVYRIISPPAFLTQLWAQIPPDMVSLKDYLQPFREWLQENSQADDYLLIQGDFGAVFLMVEFAAANGLRPVYSTTLRESVEQHLADGTVRLEHKFRHVIFRHYGC